MEVLDAVNVDQIIFPQSRFMVPTDMRPDTALIEQAARLLLEAKKPLLCVGPEVSRSRANDSIVELAELLGIPVSQGYSVYGDFPQRHPLFVGNYGLGVPRGIAGTDVFLNIGAAMPDAALITAPLPRATKVIQARVEFDDIAITQPVDVAIAADAGQTISALIESIRGMATKERLESISTPRMEAARMAAGQERQQRREKAKEYWDASPMSWERVSAELDSALEEDAIIVPELDYRTPFHWLNLDRGKKWTIGQTTGFALGWGVGAAIGVKVAMPDRQVACLVGDGALLFGQIEALWTASRCEIPVLIVVMNNRSYDNERNRIQDRAPLYRKQETRDQWKDVSGYLGKPDVDFAGLAKSFDVAGVRATKPEELRKALQRAKSVLREGRPFLIDAVIMQLDRGGKRTEQVWYPRISIASDRKRKV
jgi:benzoylformate decarboxylase